MVAQHLAMLERSVVQCLSFVNEKSTSFRSPKQCFIDELNDFHNCSVSFVYFDEATAEVTANVGNWCQGHEAITLFPHLSPKSMNLAAHHPVNFSVVLSGRSSHAPHTFTHIFVGVFFSITINITSFFVDDNTPFSVVQFKV